ncbi:MAG: hypothetical protein ACJAWP_000904 [Porticoccus sp.]|jgi:hypothetical protein|tara:strand:+ start:25070 stop:25885 length:816 start_codon:yes stop_codon:yes gene_type:complete
MPVSGVIDRVEENRICGPLRGVLLLVSASLMMVSATQAADVDDVVAAEKAKIGAAKSSQQRVDTIADEADELFQSFKQVNKQIEGLKVYNAQLDAQLADQRQTITDLESSIENATLMERQITPLTLKMINALEQFVSLDMPFLLDERRDRIARLHANLSRADLSSAEKFRQVLEAYKIESEYGARIDNYTDTVMMDGKPREVILLRVGRIALIYQTPDQQITAAWDQRSRSWQVLDSGDYRSAVAEGIRIARKRAAVDMLQLPIPAPEVVQ